MSPSPEIVAALIGTAPASISLLLQGYTTFRRSNVDRYFERLLQSNEDLKIFGSDESLQRRLFSIIEKVSNEANEEKIEHWKNATIRLATDFKDFDFKDNFIRALDFLTAFDLTVLFAIYSFEFQNEAFEEELLTMFENKSVPKEITMQSVKALASHNLISEHYDRTAVFGYEDGRPILSGTHFTKNKLGQSFLKFVSDKTINL